MCLVCLHLLASASGCAKVKAAICKGEEQVPVAVLPPDPALRPPSPAADDEAPEPEPAEVPQPTQEHAIQKEFALPFAWEKSPSEPLSRTRAYLQELARDNRAHMKRDQTFFNTLAKGETPRATVLSCADSRVQASSFDASPENDALLVRNLGNQVDRELGSIEYGVDQLRTPLFIILGHTGCDAIKMALGDTDRLSPSLQREIAPLRAAKLKAKGGKRGDSEWRDAVVKNVHNQVEAALAMFTARVNAGDLTIVGAVYDYRNELGAGAGRISIVNVNGVTEAARLRAFEQAVLSGANLNASASDKVQDPFEKLSKALAEHIHETAEESEESAPKESVIIAPAKPTAKKASPAAATPPASKRAPAQATQKPAH